MDHINMINRILEAEQKARQMTEEAEQRRRGLEQDAAEEIERIRAALYREADEKIDQARRSSNQTLAAELERIAVDTARAMEMLSQKREQKHSEWSDALLAHITE